jgi:hypothetical protein
MCFSQIAGILMFFALKPFYAKEKETRASNDDSTTEMKEIVPLTQASP